jgi:hypothetical protein
MSMPRFQKAGEAQHKDSEQGFEDMANFKCMGTTLTDKNSVHKEIKNRLNSGNACYHSV